MTAPAPTRLTGEFRGSVCLYVQPAPPDDTTEESK